MINFKIRQKPVAAINEIEFLQTDVMRFLAMICMCLMIIFSLVHSLPVNGIENTPKTKTIKRIKKIPQPVENKVLVPVQENETVAPVSAKKQGFTLGFKSNSVLFEILNKGTKVGFYILAGDKSWKLRPGISDSITFFSSQRPEKFFEMDRRTVPEKIIRAGKRSVAAFGREAVVYGVELSEDIVRQIESYMQTGQGGDLIILSNGKVELE